MLECELIEGCPFYNGYLKGDENKIEAMKEKFCRKNNLNCARYMIFMALGRGSVPPELFPHQKNKAYQIISQG